MSTTAPQDSTKDSPRLYLAFELGWSQWKLGFAPGLEGKPWRRTIAARDLSALHDAMARARDRFELPDDVPVFSCYEAGRDGFWLHRFLSEAGVDNCVVDSASIEVNRRAKRAKTDGMDTHKLLTMLIRHHQGEQKVWSVVRVPTEADEERRELHREMLELKHERTRCTNRIKGLLARCGLSVTVGNDLPDVLMELTTWDGRRFVEVYPQLHQRLGREYERMQRVSGQVRQLEQQRIEQLRHGQGREVDMARQLLSLHGVGGARASGQSREVAVDPHGLLVQLGRGGMEHGRQGRPGPSARGQLGHHVLTGPPLREEHRELGPQFVLGEHGLAFEIGHR